MTTIFHVRPKTPNIGNDLISLGMEMLLFEAFGQNVNLVTIPAKSQESRIKGSGLSARNIYEINQLADGLIVGTGNLFENGGLDCDVAALASLRVPMMLMSVSMGGVYDRSGQLIPRTDSLSPEKIRAVCQVAEPAMVRDWATAKHLDRLGVEKARVVGCPAMFLGRAMASLPRPEPEVEGAVLLSCRHPDLMSVPYSLRMQVRSSLRELIVMLRRDGHERILLVCHDYQDLAFAQEFPDLPALYTEDPRRFLGWLRDCEFNITFRLHGFLSSLAMGRPSIHLSYDERGHSMISAVGMTDWEVNFVKSPNVVTEVQNRCASLREFARVRQEQQPVWEQLCAAMMEGTTAFAERVRAYRSTRVL